MYCTIICCLGMLGMLILERVIFDGLVSLMGMVGYCARTLTHTMHAIGLCKHRLKMKVRCQNTYEACINS